MAKFVVECPHCGLYAEAKTGFFARKKIRCKCGNMIDVRTDTMAARKCPHCGNTVLFDRTLGTNAKCPVCHELINTLEDQTKIVEFTCAQCGAKIRAPKGARSFTCPVCDCENDVQQRVSAENIRSAGKPVIVRYEGDDQTLVWKNPVEDFPNGSELIVHESQQAIFFQNGQALDCFNSGRYLLGPESMPLLNKICRLPSGSALPFHSEVYFINMSTLMGIKWGTDSKVRLFDPATGIHVEIGASGEFNIRVTDPRRLLIKVVGTTGGLKQSDLMGSSRGDIRSLIMTQVKSFLGRTIREQAIGILEIDERLMELSEALKTHINSQLSSYGLEITEFLVTKVVTPDDDPNFRRMKQQFADQYLKVREEQILRSEALAAQERKAVQAQTAAQLKVIGAQGDADALRIQKAAEVEAYRMQAAAEAEEMRLKGYTYQQETVREAVKNGIGNTADVDNFVKVTIGQIVTKEMAVPSSSPKAAPLYNMTDSYQEVPRPAVPPASVEKETWDCPVCGEKGITRNFCPECGAKKPVPQPAADTWNCPVCGEKGITRNFCPECGAKRPAQQPATDTWDCPVCGEKGITRNFCPECGTKKRN